MNDNDNNDPKSRENSKTGDGDNGAIRIIHHRRSDWPLPSISGLTGESETESDYKLRYMQLVENINDGIVIDDHNSTIGFANSGFCRMLGYSLQEMIGSHILDFVDGRDQEILMEQISRRMEGENDPYEIALTNKDGEKVYTIISPSPLYGRNNEFIGSIAVITDITKRKMAEEALKQAHQDLERKVIERTKELARINLEMSYEISERKKVETELKAANERLKIEQDALEKKNIALKEVLGQIEHEKQQIAARIQSNINRAAMPVIQKLAEKIEPSHEDILNYLKGNLADIVSPFINKIETEYSKLTPREIEICNMIRNGLTSKEIAYSLDISEETVRSQRKKIRVKLGIARKKTSLSSFLNSQ